MRSNSSGYKLKSNSFARLKGLQTRPRFDSVHLPLTLTTHRYLQHMPTFCVLPKQFGRKHVRSNSKRHTLYGIKNLACHAIHALYYQLKNYQGEATVGHELHASGSSIYPCVNCVQESGGHDERS